MLKVPVERFYTVIFSIAYTIMIYAAYFLVSQKYAYSGFIIRTDINPLVLISLTFLAVLPSTFISLSYNRPSSLVVWMLYLYVYIPSVFVPYFSGLLPFYVVLLYALNCLLCIFILSKIDTAAVLVLKPMNVVLFKKIMVYFGAAIFVMIFLLMFFYFRNIINFVGLAFITGRGFDANAKFWAASTIDFGFILEPLLITMLLYLYLTIYNSIALYFKRQYIKYYYFASVLIIGFITSLINTALFTALLTGGGIGILLLLYVILSFKYSKNRAVL